MAEKRYESTFIIKGSLGEEEVETIITKIEETIAKNGGSLIETERWGRRKLAYPIEKETSGFYISEHFTAPGPTVARLERIYQLDEQIMRWLTLIMPESNFKGRAAMKKRIEDVSVRREAQSALAAQEEAAQIAGHQRPPRVVEQEETAE